MSLSIGARLTLFSSAVLSVVLASAAAASYLVYARSRIAAIDEQLARAEAVVARALADELDQGLPLDEAAHDALEDLDVPSRAFAVFDSGGTLLAGAWHGLPERRHGEAAALVETNASGPGSFRVRRASRPHRGVAFEVGVAESLAPLEQELAFLRRALAGGVVAALLLAAAGGWWVARRALRPVTRMAAEARGISERTPGSRLSTPGARDELRVLAEAFNGLLGRLERALVQQRQFVADASHELRTPVSVARTAIEVGLGRSGRPEAEYRDSLAVVGEQMRRLSGLVEDMFLLARADMAALPLAVERLYLDELALSCLAEARLLGGPKGALLSYEGPQDVEISGDPKRLRQMLMNLLANAVRHAAPGGSIKVEIAALAHGSTSSDAAPAVVRVAVTDCGPGIPQAERERIFERFVRLDAARTSADGAGLGLPIARMIAEVHGGSLTLARSDASGSRFVVELPA